MNQICLSLQETLQYGNKNESSVSMYELPDDMHLGGSNILIAKMWKMVWFQCQIKNKMCYVSYKNMYKFRICIASIGLFLLRYLWESWESLSRKN